METFLASLGVFFLSSIKFLMGLSIALVRDNIGLLPSYVTTVGGGIVGVFAFTFFGELINKGYKKIFPNRVSKKFTKLNRFLVGFRNKFGVPGIAFLTPFLSVPIGIFLSLSISKDKWKIITFMSLSFALWSSVFFLPKHFFQLNLYEFFTTLI